MTLDITYDGDVADLTLKTGAPVEVRERPTGHGVYGFRYDGNLSRLTFDPGAVTDMELLIRPGSKWPRFRRRPGYVHNPNDEPTPPDNGAPIAPEAPNYALSDGSLSSGGTILSDGTVA